MTQHIQNLLQYFIVEKNHHQFRAARPSAAQLAEEYARAGLPDLERAKRRLAWMLEAEQPVVLPSDRIALLRTVTAIPELFTPLEWEEIRQHHAVHEQGKVCNINPAYALLLQAGTTQKRREIEASLEAHAGSAEKTAYLHALLATLDAVEAFADRYRAEAERVGNHTVAESFARIPRQPPQSFLQALQFLRLLHYSLWCSFNYHNTLGRFDQYMLPFYQADIESGALTQEGALELLEEFFISCNKDSDLYTGMQQGDNGQSLVLGGLNADGSDSYNALSALCLQASLELKLIDPKINLRVNKNTPLERYVQGSRLTRQGLGFPQYANDDVVIPALKNWGYEDKDAHNYVVAACWEFIVPGTGMDIPNINGLSFSQAVTQVALSPKGWNSWDSLMARVKEAIFAQAKQIMAETGGIYMEPAPLMSLMMEGCVENARDISLGGKYNNYGIHGTGLSTAVDSLAAMRKYLFEEPTFSKEDLARMLMDDFAGKGSILSMLRYQAPKMGNDDDSVDALAVQLLDWFADALDGHRNDRGGIFRGGTGSAMYYIWHAAEQPASPDGRQKGEALACNYSPSLFSRCRGPISIIKSFAKPHLVRVANGGPLTIELHHGMFKNDESLEKVARFVKSFIDMGGHQMQLNAVDREELLDAKAHPEKHAGLIVRVWGWSGYFVELDEVYQDHIIQRTELSLD